MGTPRAAASCRGTTAVGQSLLGILIRAQIVDPDREFGIRLGGGFVADVYIVPRTGRSRTVRILTNTGSGLMI